MLFEQENVLYDEVSGSLKESLYFKHFTMADAQHVQKEPVVKWCSESPCSHHPASAILDA